MSTRRAPAARWSAGLAVGALTIGVGSGLVAPASAAEDHTHNGGAARLSGDQTQAIRDSIVDGPAKNVILIIGDGMGDSEITVARNYAEGAGGTFAGIDALPLTGSYTTWAVDEDGSPNYASESASTATAWSTGTKTVNGRLGVDVDNAAQSTLLEIAKANGRKTGNVSTAEIQDATPGAQVSHISQRGCYGPEETSAKCADEALESGGLGSISEQLLNLRPDVTLGGGAASFSQSAKAGPWEGETLFTQAEQRGYQLVNDLDGLDAVTAADQSRPLLGLFTDGNFPVRWQGPQATIGGGDQAAQQCRENPERLNTGLSLRSLTSKAVDLLDNNDGFFLQVEGASIDKQDHAADACGQIGETVDLDEAVQAALDFAKADGDTLVIVTADHAHTSQIVGSTPPGLSARLQTDEGQSMIVSYGTAPAGGSQQHTGSQVRIAAYGPGGANVVGLTDQTDVFFTSIGALQLNRDLAALSADASITSSADEVAPGEEFTVSVQNLKADWTTEATAGEADLGQKDVIDGSVDYTVTAPAEPGEIAVAVTGSQTDTSLSVPVVVTDGAGGGAGPGGDDGQDDGGASPAPSDKGGSLPMTGATITLLLLLVAATAIAAGTAIARHRRHGITV
ncbi:alkaline phosphatase [Aeromicrobium piscarium]|uniref:Alkaline phosphatase n=1 Tax=Aeromicrobium piscarium TaxID=2590901 RepID=A0A554RX23_9ACTN|nr:alkaline phosphatase [Aeromicrobium piscarium]TSD58630.1 alkaline phosphatase [Aeromicrobium piscarium]